MEVPLLDPGIKIPKPLAGRTTNYANMAGFQGTGV